MQRTIVPQLIPALALLWVTPVTAGVLLGNPFRCEVQPNEGSVSAADAYVVEYILDDCAGKTTRTSVADDVDFVAGVDWTLPADDWCTLTLKLSGSLVVSGTVGGSGYTDSVSGDLVLDRVSGSPDGFSLDDVGLSAASVGVSVLAD